ncbi:HD-GYP domain-containing protein [Thermotoga sp. KOL6]|uniref:HD-GYP domain-containing protein n=1 Tax=Thermotoga sp. KOL6 TaxID=126741 RepID=UPI000C7861D7|nr:HD-GYP domain-containing protein [Thermotoga sp. KOL6]PLV58660.1 phosphodiesterase [Thermotoga sp. KOL6]
MIKILANLLKTIPSLGKHSFQVAFLSARIAEKLHLETVTAFLAGLFHDIGLILPWDKKIPLENIDDAFIIARDTPGKPLHLHSILGSFVVEYTEKFKFLSPIILKHHFPALYLTSSKKEDVFSNIVFISDQVSRYSLINLDVDPKAILIPLEEMKSFFFPEVFEACKETLETEFARWQLEHILTEFTITDYLQDYTDDCPEYNLEDISQFGKVVSFVVDSKSEFTSEHTWRVAKIAEGLAKSAGRDEKTLFVAGLFHDIGKISVSYRILEKPAKLSDEEFNLMKKHVYFSYLILLPVSDREWFLPAVRHHERVDGSGYPFKLKGEEMSFEDKIIQVADVFGALLEKRPYRSALDPEKALGIIKEEVEEGKLDREVFEILETTVKDFNFESIEIGRKLRDEIQNFVNKAVEKFGDYVL